MHDALAGVRGLKVAAQPVGNPAESDVKELGRLLGVATVLQASVRREGPRVRVNARLSDTHTGFTLWSRTYDRESSDVFALQSEIANQVVQSLLGVLPADKPRPRARPSLAPRACSASAAKSHCWARRRCRCLAISTRPARRLDLAREHGIPIQRIQASPVLRRLHGAPAAKAPDGA